MSDEPQAEPPPDTAPPPPRPRRDPLVWLNTAGIVILAAVLVWLARQQIAPTPGQTDALAQQIGTLEARVARLEQRPVPQPPDLAPLNARIAALEQRPAGGAAPDLAPLEARIGALEQRKPADLAPLEARVGALEAKQPPETALIGRVDALDKGMAGISQRSDRLVRILAAQAALDAGRPLGKLADAPPALATFSATPPPTLAGLRLAFPAAAQAALAVSPAPVQGQPWYARLWAEARELVTIRRGAQVLLGDPAAGVLDQARERLDAGDLAGAVELAGGLSGAKAAAMRDWLADARALLAARAALAEWAAHG